MNTKPYVQCKLASPCTGGTSYQTSFIPEERAKLGLKAMLGDRVWKIVEAYTELVVEGEYVAWYINFNQIV